MDEQPFENIAVTAQVGPSHAAGVVRVRERAFEILAAATQQSQTARSTDASTVGVHRGAGLRFIPPTPPLSVTSSRSTSSAGSTMRRRRDQRRLHGGRVPVVGVLHRHGHDSPGVEIDRVLGFVREVRPSGRPSSW